MFAKLIFQIESPHLSFCHAHYLSIYKHIKTATKNIYLDHASILFTVKHG